jgi:hypothetical protein
MRDITLDDRKKVSKRAADSHPPNLKMMVPTKVAAIAPVADRALRKYALRAMIEARIRMSGTDDKFKSIPSHLWITQWNTVDNPKKLWRMRPDSQCER